MSFDEDFGGWTAPEIESVCEREIWEVLWRDFRDFLREGDETERERERFQRFENSSPSHKLCKSVFLSFLSAVCIFLSPIIDAGSWSETFALLQNSFV